MFFQSSLEGGTCLLSQMRTLKPKRLVSDFPKAVQLETQQRLEPRPVSPASVHARPGPAPRRRLRKAGPAVPTRTAPAAPAWQVGRSPQPVDPVASGPGLWLSTHGPHSADGTSRQPPGLCAFPHMATLAAARPGSRRANGGTSLTCTTPRDHGGTEAPQHGAPGHLACPPEQPSPQVARNPGGCGGGGQGTEMHRDARRCTEAGHRGPALCSRRGGLSLSAPFAGLCSTSLARSQ